MVNNLRQFTINLRFTLGLVLLTTAVLIAGCSSGDDDSGNDDASSNQERELIEMEPGTDLDLNNYDWNNSQLVLSVDFSNGYLLGENWNFEKNNNNPDKADQLQVYREKNVRIINGKMEIFAERVGDGQDIGDYTSARLNSKFAMQYGRMEIRASLPEGEKNGVWAKIGLIGENVNTVGYPESGELDIMEYFSYLPNQTNITVQTASNNADTGNLLTQVYPIDTAEEEYHNYGILWTEDQIEFYVDDVDNIIYSLTKPVNSSVNNWPFDQPFYLLLDLVIGGRIAGAQGVDPSLEKATMMLEYIRIYHAK